VVEAAEVGAQQPGRRPGGGLRPGCDGRASGAHGRRPGRRSLGAAGGRRASGARVGSGGGGHADRGSADLSRVRERGAGAHDIFLNKAITFVGHS
jgi:hypothetical protein